jgi:hypothetical protein
MLICHTRLRLIYITIHAFTCGYHVIFHNDPPLLPSYSQDSCQFAVQGKQGEEEPGWKSKKNKMDIEFLVIYKKAPGMLPGALVDCG